MMFLNRKPCVSMKGNHNLLGIVENIFDTERICFELKLIAKQYLNCFFFLFFF